MSEQYSIEEIPVNFNKIVQEVEQGDSIEVTRQGKQIAVIISAAEYEKLRRSQCFGESLEQFRQEYNVETAEINPDEIFAGVRDFSPGREASF
jgi:prevent-host-death family protein